MLLPIFTTVTLALTVSASKLFVSSYTGNITTLDLTERNGIRKLSQIQVNHDCAPNASWLYLDSEHENLYCVDENFVGTNGSLHSFKLDKKSGALTHLKRSVIPLAPVHSTIYTSPNGKQLLAIAHYAWALTTYKLSPKTGQFKPIQHFNFTMEKPGADAARQAAPHPHQVLVDPRNEYFVVPDLGADILRIFHINPRTLRIVAKPSVKILPGSGPRHGAFLTRESQVYYYLVTELSNELFSYKVEYLPNWGGLSFKQISSASTYGGIKALEFAGNAASEIAIAPNAQSLLVSNRNATYFAGLRNPDPNNATLIASDTFATFAINPPVTDELKFQALSPAGGSFPRHFTMNKEGSLVAVALQNSGRVVIYERCVTTGEMNHTAAADFEGLGGVTSIVWVE